MDLARVTRVDPRTQRGNCGIRLLTRGYFSEEASPEPDFDFDMKPKAVVFDFDNTLVDTRGADIHAYSQVFFRDRCFSRQDFASLLSRDSTFRKSFAYFPIPSYIENIQVTSILQQYLPGIGDDASNQILIKFKDLINKYPVDPMWSTGVDDWRITLLSQVVLCTFAERMDS